MDPPPLPPLPTPTPATTVTQAATTATPTTHHLNYTDSVESRSPRFHAPETLNSNEPLPPVPGAKLRLMCSYSGHIIPRPHDKSLCYVGGETRMVAIDRNSSLSSFSSRLSRTLPNGRPFTLKYQLPHEDLDSLVSVTTDEDLENMVEEYDRITTSSSSSSTSSSSRIRLFLFSKKPETAASMGSLLDDAKSETWFVDALNGSGLLPRNLSDSATMDNCLVALHGDHDLEAHVDDMGGANMKQVKDSNHNNDKNVVVIQDLHSTILDSPLVENSSSSFGSSSSTPCMSNLPLIRVRVAPDDDQIKVGVVEEQLAQVCFAQTVHKQDDGYGHFGGAVPVSASFAAVGVGPGGIVQVNSATGCSSESLNRISSDDERSDQGVPVSFRKPPLAPLQPVQHKAGAYYNLPFPDSVESDTSIASAGSLSKPMYYQDQSQVAHRDSRAPLSPDTKDDVSISTPQVQIQQVQDSSYPCPPQLDQQQQQQQFVATGTQFITHPATTPVPTQSYYPVYATPSQQQQPHLPIDQQYPVYVMPVTHTQPYMSMQSNMVDTTIVASSRPVTPPTPTPTVLAASAVYKDLQHPPIYPSRTAATSARAEVPSNVYGTAMNSAPQLVQIPASQFQNHYVGYSQVQHPTQSITVTPAATANYACDYSSNVTHDQVYYTPHQAAPLPPQYQTVTPVVAVALADTSKQQPTSNIPQQIGTSQPL